MTQEDAVRSDGVLVHPADTSILDHPVWASLTGPHAHLAQLVGQAARYPVDVCPFVALSPQPDERGWDDLATLVGAGVTVPLVGVQSAPPEHWQVVGGGDGVQMVDVALGAEDHPDVQQLGRHDVPAMLDLVARNRPGPFLPGTVELGTYLGIRREGGLVAMAGERLHPPGWTEISAVCTDAAFRNQGLATTLVRAVAAGIRNRNETPFLHVAASNVTAIRLYESLGFAVRRRVRFDLVRVPDANPAP